MKDLSNYIESLLDGVLGSKDYVVKYGNHYIITIIKENLPNHPYHGTEMNFIKLTDSVKVRRHLETYFPNDEVMFEINFIFV